MIKYQNIFYHIIGKHMNETPQQIIERKAADLEKNTYSLWTAKINKPCIDEVRKLSENDEVYVLCRVNPKAKDPKGEKPVAVAVKMKWDNTEQMISPDISQVTYTKGTKYQSYVVGEYIIPDSPVSYDFSGYVSSNGKTFRERMAEFSRFQNCFGKLDSSISKDSKTKDISIIMKLKYPFVVDVE